MRATLALLVLACCKREGATTANVDAAVATPAVASSAAVVSAPDAAAPELATLERWNAALDAADTAALAALYAPNVKYYGKDLDAATCVKSVAAALAKSPGYHQDVAKARVTYELSTPRVFVEFEKRTGGKTYDAYLVLDRTTWKITEESDRTTDANLVKLGRCFTYQNDVSFTGTLRNEDFPVGDHVESGTILHLDHAICVVRTGERGDGGDGAYLYDLEEPRIDGVETLHFMSAKPVPPSALGKHVTIAGSLVPKETVHHFTPVMLIGSLR